MVLCVVTRPPVSQFRSSAERRGQALALILMSGGRRIEIVFDFRSSVDPFGFDLGPTSGYLACALTIIVNHVKDCSYLLSSLQE